MKIISKPDANAATPMTIPEVSALLRQDRPDLDPGRILSALQVFVAWRGEDIALAVPPSRHEIETFLADASNLCGDHRAATDLSHVQAAAPVLWGIPNASMIGIVLRQRRCTSKAPKKSKDDAARMMIGQLPTAWQPGLIDRLSSEPGRPKAKWSADYTLAVAQAMVRWIRWCENLGQVVRPAGVSFNAYACDLSDDGVSSRSAADYLGRIQSGYGTVEPGFYSQACDHVIFRLRARGKNEGRPTKTGDQLVGASTIFDLGMEIIEDARRRGPRGLHVARDYRNGLLLSTAAAVPQRARALSHFDFGRSVILLEFPYIRIRLPGKALKLREHMKDHVEYDKVFKIPDLWAAIEEFQRLYRPLFDNGTALFPSIHDIGTAISSAQLGCLVGNLTERHLKVRISIQRVRDNVATEASEELRGGGYLAPALLNHRNAATTMASYDHAQGMAAAREHAEFVTLRRSLTAKLRL